MWRKQLSSWFVLSVLLFGTGTLLEAQVRTSTSYQIQSDSINIAGGYSSSTNFQQESTVGEIATGRSTSTSFNLYAGYQQMQTAFISISAAADVSLTPAIVGITGGVSNGSTTVTVVTDSAAGYQLSLVASDAPAMRSGANTLSDYVPSGAPDFGFTTSSTAAHFGFSPSGPDVVQRFLDNGVDTCDTDSNETALACWDGLSTSPAVIAQSIGSNQPAGASTTIYFRVGVGGAAIVTPGTYVATTTLTALAL